MKLLLATRSAHKTAEVRRIVAAAEAALALPDAAGLHAPRLRLVDLHEAGIPESPAEDELERFDTFEENAAAKAEWFAALAGIPAVADDSGLEVDVLGGRPGVRTKRFAPVDAYPGLSRDEANNRHLLRLLQGVPPARRGARYVCVASLALPADAFPERRERSAASSAPVPTALAPASFRGEAPGSILESERGSGGFGYDPIVLAAATNRTYAELAPEEKDRRSHRGQAFRALVRHLALMGGVSPARQASLGRHLLPAHQDQASPARHVPLERCPEKTSRP